MPLVDFGPPLELGQGGPASNDLITPSFGGGTVLATLSVTVSLRANINGSSTVAATLTQVYFSSVFITGVATVTATLAVTASPTLNNLAVVIAGKATVTATFSAAYGGIPDPRAQARYLYQFVDGGIGFDPIDDASTKPGFISQSYPDGASRSFARWLYQFVDVGVGFNPIDDASTKPGFISQTFPDGHVRSFARYLHLLVNIIKGSIPDGQLIIRPGYTTGPILPAATPPSTPHT